MKGDENIKKNDVYDVDLDPINKVASMVTSKGVHFDIHLNSNQKKREKPLHNVIYKGPKNHNLIGKRFGRFVVVGYLGKRRNDRPALWDVRCDCGLFEVRRTTALKNKKAISKCGHCQYLDFIRHDYKYSNGLIK